MSYLQMDGGSRIGFAGGTLLSILMSVRPGELLESALLALTGTTVSFFASLGLRFLIRKMRRKRRRSADERAEY
jgi:hypothetical protein